MEALQARWLTREAAAKYCSLSIPTIDRLVSSKRIRSSKVPLAASKSRRLIDRDSLDQLIESYVEESTK